MAHQWGYTTVNGPATWQCVAPAARGLHQSPVNIKANDVIYDADLSKRPLSIHYDPSSCKTLINNGHSLQAVVDAQDTSLESGPYAHKYRAAQFHFHWGKTSHEGAEHLIDGKAYAAELHIVHWNTELCSSVTEALKSANGLAVLCVFLQVGAENQALKKLVDLMANVKYAGDKTDIVGGFDPASLLPADRSKYWTYSGSLTTPPCYESVRFILFKDPVHVSEEQMNAFRQLVSHGRSDKGHNDEFHGHIVNNYRPTLPLNDRKILASFN